jgi:hypothetical protein
VAERGEIIQIDRHEVKITRPDKILFPDDWHHEARFGRLLPTDLFEDPAASASPSTVRDGSCICPEVG